MPQDISNLKMNRRKSQLMFQVIRENNFEDKDNINCEYLCTICHKILIESCSASCGCRYCKSCITAYLKDGMKICPGDSEYCKSGVIDIDNDINIDQTIDTRICRLVVKCPNIGCETKADIISMEDHLKVCEKQSVPCPFANMGCENNVLNSDRVNEHLWSEVHSHSKLLMEWVNVSRNDSNISKNDIKELRSENHDLEERVERAENVIRDFQNKDINNVPQIDLLIKEMRELRNENMFFKKELIKMQDGHRASNFGLREKVEEQIQEIDQLKCQYQMMEKQFDDKLKFQEKKYQNIEIKVNEISLSTANLKEESNETVELIDFLQKSIDKLNFGDFVWPIDNWTAKQNQSKTGQNTEIHSKPFFTSKNSYKMCLEVHPNGYGSGKGTHLSIFYYIMKGPFDEILSWPCKQDVVITLMNQKTGLVHCTETVAYSDKPDFVQGFIKPISEKNFGYGRPKFIKLEDISTVPGLLENDQILIKCTVKPRS